MEPTHTLRRIQSEIKNYVPQNKSELSNTNKEVGKPEEVSKVSAEDVEKSLQNLRTQIEEVQKLSTVPKEDNHYKITDISNNLGLLNPFEEADLKEDMKSQNEQQHEVTSIEELMASGKSAKEKVEFLRKNPEMLAEFMRREDQAKAEAVRKQREDAYKRRLKQQEIQTQIIRQSRPDYQPPELTRDYLGREKQLIKNGHYKPTNQLIKNKFKTAKLEFRQMEVQRELQLREMDKFNHLTEKFAREEKVESILPVTYISERNKLLTIMKLACNMAILRDVSSVYSQINTVNMQYIRSCTKIQQYFKMFNQSYKFRCETAVLAKIQKLAKHHINMRRYELRLSSMHRVKQLLLYQYNSNAFLGTVLNFSNRLHTIMQHLKFNQEKKWARKAIFTGTLARADIDVTRELLKQHEVKRRNIENQNSKDPKKRRKVVTEDEIEVTDDYIDSSKIQAKAVVFNAIVEAVYNKLLSEKAALLAEQNENKFEDFPAAVFTLGYHTCVDIFRQVRVIGADVDENEAVWLQEEQFAEYLQGVTLSEVDDSDAAQFDTRK